MFMFKKKSQQPPTSSTQLIRQSRHLTLLDIQKATNNFDESLLIGRGTFAEVYKAEVSNGETLVLAAIKRMNAGSDRGAPAAWPEVERLSTFRHRNLASLIGYYVKDVTKKPAPRSLPICEKEVLLVYEYVPNGTLKDHLHVYHTSLSWTLRLNICLDVARALHYLQMHTRTEATWNDVTLMHGDIKSSNILLTESWTAKVSDFGLSKIGPEDRARDSNIIPLAKGRKSDVYSFGILLLEILCRKPAVDETIDETHEGSQRNLMRWVRDCVEQGKMEDIVDPDIKNEVSLENLKEFLEIVERCLNERPKQRPDMAEVVRSLGSVLGDPSNRKRNTKVPADSKIPRPSVKEFTFDDLEKATRVFSRRLISDEGDVFLGWVEQSTLAPSEEGVGIAVVVKRITSVIPRSYNEWLEEVNFLGEFVHPNIIRLLGCCNIDENEHLLIYEHKNKSLSKFIHGDEPLSWKTRLHIMIGVARGLTYLYTKKDVLCHFQCNDILVDEDFNAKIGGFGWTEIQERHDRKQLNGAFGYLKADNHYISTGRSLIKNDICSFGSVLLETITGRHLSDFEDIFMGLGSLEMQAPKSKSNIKKLKEMMDPRLEDSYSIEGAFKCMSLASRCISIHPKFRPSRGEILWSLEQIYALDN